MVKHGNIHSIIPTPYKKVPTIPLVNNSYTRERNQTDSSLTFLRTETRKMLKIFTSIFSIKREGII